MLREECSNCKFWHEAIPSICMRFPPVFTGFGESEYSDYRPEFKVGAWSSPVTHEKDWCGEYSEVVGA